MPNLELIQGFHRKHNIRTSIDDVNLSEIELNEAIDPERIEKAILRITDQLGISFQMHFDLELPAELVLMYIDICNFSTRFQGINYLSEVLDEYYDIVVPIIYEHGGEIDKIIGDGIICFFGPPFSNFSFDKNLAAADLAAKEILSATNNTSFKSKIAIHTGQVRYYRNKTGYYNEYTIIGQPITELFRLESISEDQRINFFTGTPYDKLHIERLSANSALRLSDQQATRIANWLISAPKRISPVLKGVEKYNFYKTVRKGV
jgi:class 3 adenylate cyclase